MSNLTVITPAIPIQLRDRVAAFADLHGVSFQGAVTRLLAFSLDRLEGGDSRAVFTALADSRPTREPNR